MFVQTEDWLSKCGVGGKYCNYARTYNHMHNNNGMHNNNDMHNNNGTTRVALSRTPYNTLNTPPPKSLLRAYFPQVFVKGVLIGGNDDTVAEIQSGALKQRLA